MKTINNKTIDDTFAEAFSVKATRLIITAKNESWLQHAINNITGFATSVIGCDVEAGLDRMLDTSHTPDGRPGAAILFFGFGRESLEKAVSNRVGQCLLTCATTACFNGLDDTEKKIDIGNRLRYFGDGYQISKVLGEKRYWRIPVMEGEFLCEGSAGVSSAIAGGNFLILANDPDVALEAAEDAVQSIQSIDGVTCPFPGGIVRSGSKVGSKYAALKASTNHQFCPTLKGLVESELQANETICYEIVIDGLSENAITEAMTLGIQKACEHPISRISAGNYGGNLGKHHFHLNELLKEHFDTTE